MSRQDGRSRATRLAESEGALRRGWNELATPSLLDTAPKKVLLQELEFHAGNQFIEVIVAWNYQN